MAVAEIHFISISCNGPGCDKTVTYDAQKQKETVDHPDNIWLRELRSVQTPDGRKFCYCSDICEVKAIETGSHNTPEQKQIIETPANPSLIRQAAEAARKLEQTNNQLKTGR